MVRLAKASSEGWTRDLAAIECARRGWRLERTSWFDARAKRTHDLFGVFDGVAFVLPSQRYVPNMIGMSATIGLQWTSAPNHAARVAKLRQADILPCLLRAGWTVLCWSFREDGRLREEEVT